MGKIGISFPSEIPLGTKKMADEITRPELDAKLELIETRMDGRLSDITHHIETLLDVNQRMVSETKEARKESKNWGIGVIATVVTTAIAMLIGVWQIVSGTSQSNIAWFESGRNIGVQQATPQQLPQPAKK